ncbi:MAG: TetR family transcriptional regulatory protein [Gemmatimonadetes bacterium]|nr:TetR family transcriptional regulatory protein [Gemmatimonadota bacterium]
MRERILQTAEALLRRHGPSKTSVVDVSRAMQMSHANVYRHFASKAALHDAIAERWLHRVSTPLADIASGPGTASERLEAWVLALMEMKRRKVLDDPEMFATYHAVATAARGVIDAHVTTLQNQLCDIIESGMVSGEFTPTDAGVAARAVLDATARFHHPHHVLDAATRDAADEVRAARAVIGLISAGLRA